MKKIISILLVAMLIIGMFPATALTAFAAYEKATSIAAGDTVVLVSGTNELNGISTTSTKYGLYKTYSGTPAGVYALKVMVGSKTDTFAFQTPDGKYLYWSSGNSLNVTNSITDNSSWNVSFSGDNAVITNAGTTERKLQWNASSPRFACYTTNQTAVQLYKLTGVVCEHPNAEVQSDGYDAKCGAPGKTNSVYCPDCDTTITPQETIPALQHNYVDGKCKLCGEPQPTSGTVQLSFANQTYRTSYAPNKAVYANDGITVTNNKGTYNNSLRNDSSDDHVRFYAGTEVIIDCAVGNMTKLVFTCSSESYATELADSIGAEAVASGTTVTVTLTTPAASYTIAKIGAQTRVKTLAVTFEAASEEPETPVVQVGNKEYTSVNEALTEIAANGGTLKLLAPVENIAVDGELKLDLNGKTATNVTATKIYAYDSSAKKTDEGTGALTTTSEVVTDNTVDGVRYIALNNEGTYTFHVLELKLNAVSLRAGAAGIYYKAEMNCDATLKAAIEYHGTVVSINNMPGADFDAETNDDVNRWTQIQKAPTGAFTTCSVFGIFKDGNPENATRGETKIYANAYIQLEGTNEIIMADTTTDDKADDQGFDGIAWSLKDVMEKLDTMYSDMTDANKKASIVKFYENWADAMTTWSVANIAADATSAK